MRKVMWPLSLVIQHPVTLRITRPSFMRSSEQGSIGDGMQRLIRIFLIAAMVTNGAPVGGLRDALACFARALLVRIRDRGPFGASSSCRAAEDSSCVSPPEDRRRGFSSGRLSLLSSQLPAQTRSATSRRSILTARATPLKTRVSKRKSAWPLRN